MLSSRPPQPVPADSAGPQAGLAGQVRDAVAYCLAPVRLRRTLAIALVVGTILTTINLGDMIIDGEATGVTLVKAGLNYLVPFVVSNLGLLSGRDAGSRAGPG